MNHPLTKRSEQAFKWHTILSSRTNVEVNVCLFDYIGTLYYLLSRSPKEKQLLTKHNQLQSGM